MAADPVSPTSEARAALADALKLIAEHAVFEREGYVIQEPMVLKAKLRRIQELATTALRTLPAAQPTGMREAFEEWFADISHRGYEHDSPNKEDHWMLTAWQAALTWQASRQPAVVPEALSSQQAEGFRQALETISSLADDAPWANETGRVKRMGAIARVELERVPPSALSQQAEGWVLVPREPTEAMLEATLDARKERCEPYTAERESGVAVDQDMTEEDANYCNLAAKEGYAEVYRAMIAAAPSAPIGERAAGLTEEERAVLQYARGALQYAYGNVSSATADKVKQAIIPALDRLTKTDAEKEE